MLASRAPIALGRLALGRLAVALALACASGCRRATPPGGKPGDGTPSSPPASLPASGAPPSSAEAGGDSGDAGASKRRAPVGRPAESAELHGPAEPFLEVIEGLRELDADRVAAAFVPGRLPEATLEELRRRFSDPARARQSLRLLDVVRWRVGEVREEGDRAHWVLLIEVPDVEALSRDADLLSQYGLEPPAAATAGSAEGLASRARFFTELTARLPTLVREKPERVPWVERSQPLTSVRRGSRWRLDTPLGELPVGR